MQGGRGTRREIPRFALRSLSDRANRSLRDDTAFGEGRPPFAEGAKDGAPGLPYIREKEKLMKITKTVGTAVAIVAACLLAGFAVNFTARGAEDADLVIYNAKVLTVDKAFSIKSAVAVRNGKLVAVGSNEIAKQYSAPAKLDLHGRVLMPGFTDT